MEYRIRSFRIDDEVWEAVQKHELSANQLLRQALQLTGTAPRPNKRERVAQELAASDVTAQVVERDDIEYGHHETLPRGEHVAFKGQLLKPSEKKKR